MKRIFVGIILMLALPLLGIGNDAQAKVKFGIRGGANITKMSFDSKLLDKSNRTGFFIGPTLKIGLPLGFDIDASALYNQIEANSDLNVTGEDFDEKFPNLKRKAIAVPLNLRKGFGFGDKFDLFIFAGPQFDFNINGDISYNDVNWKWKDSAVSVNVGLGFMLLNHLEVKANYNIPCSTVGEFKISDIAETEKGKTNTWQIGLAYYF